MRAHRSSVACFSRPRESVSAIDRRSRDRLPGGLIGCAHLDAGSVTSTDIFGHFESRVCRDYAPHRFVDI
jgi:hypothetical protein